MFLDEITTGEVKRYVAHLEKRGLAPASVAKAVIVVRLLFASAVEDDDYGLPSNPALGVRVGRRRGVDEPETVKVLAFEEFERLLGALPEETRLFFDFLFETGLRISEAIELAGAMSTSAAGGCSLRGSSAAAGSASRPRRT
jgi:site-specific recombinase XerD